ncbi:MAG: hypothetical protein ACLT3Y_03595 [Ruminococcus callidus]
MVGAVGEKTELMFELRHHEQRQPGSTIKQRLPTDWLWKAT